MIDRLSDIKKLATLIGLSNVNLESRCYVSKIRNSTGLDYLLKNEQNGNILNIYIKEPTGKGFYMTSHVLNKHVICITPLDNLKLNINLV